MATAEDFPRRSRRELMTSAELAITGAMEEVEKLPPHEQLTSVMVHLAEARNKVADFVDRGLAGIEVPEPPAPDPNQCPTCKRGILVETTGQERVKHNGEEGEITARFSICDACEAEMNNAEQIEANMRALAEFRQANPLTVKHNLAGAENVIAASSARAVKLEGGKWGLKVTDMLGIETMLQTGKVQVFSKSGREMLLTDFTAG